MEGFQALKSSLFPQFVCILLFIQDAYWTYYFFRIIPLSNTSPDLALYTSSLNLRYETFNFAHAVFLLLIWVQVSLPPCFRKRSYCIWIADTGSNVRSADDWIRLTQTLSSEEYICRFWFSRKNKEGKIALWPSQHQLTPKNTAKSILARTPILPQLFY